MVDYLNLEDIAARLVGKSNPTKVYHGSMYGLLDNVDFNYYGKGEGSKFYDPNDVELPNHYSIDDYKTAGHYAGKGLGYPLNQQGAVNIEYLPDEKYYINPDLPFNQQSKEVQEALIKAGYYNPSAYNADDYYKYMKGELRIKGLSPMQKIDLYNQIDNALTKYGENKAIETWLNYVNKNPEVSFLPGEKLVYGGNDVLNYREALKAAKEAGLEGIVRYKPAMPEAGLKKEARVFQSLHPENIEIANNPKLGRRLYGDFNEYNKTLQQLAEGLNKAKELQQAILNRPAIQGVFNHPMTKALGKAAGTIMNATNAVGDAMLVGDYINKTSQWHPDNIQWNQSGNPIPTRGVGMVVPASQQQPWEASPVRLYGGISYYD